MIRSHVKSKSETLCVRRKGTRCLAIIGITLALLVPLNVEANPYLAKAGERPVTVRIATCAVSGGFTHLYAALDNRIFDKYGLKLEHIYIRGSGASLAALATNEIQFLFCAAEATIPGLAAGIEAKLIAAPLVGLPYVLVARKDIKRPEDLKGKSIGVTRPGDLSARLSRAVLKKFNLTTEEVQIRPLGGSQSERYQAMAADVVQGILVTSPLDVKAKNDGFNLVYRLNDLNLPFIYSSLHTNAKMTREKSELVQAMVAAFAESVHFVEKNPDQAKASLAKALKLKDQEILESAYNAYAKEIINRSLLVPLGAVGESIEIAREGGSAPKKKADEIVDNSFAQHLEKSGFLKELWGSQLQKPAK